MKKVGVYLSNDPSWGGTFQYSLSLLQSLKSLGMEHVIELEILYEKESWAEVLTKMGFKNNFSMVPAFTPFRALYKAWRILKLPTSLWRKFCELFHPAVNLIKQKKCSAWFFPSQEPMSYFGQHRAITSIHDLMHRYESQFPEVGDPAEVRLRDNLYSNICRYSYRILVDSEVGKKHVLDSYGMEYKEKIKVLPYVIPDYLESKKADFAIFSKFNISEKFFFYPAQFWSHKNHLRLIKAFAVVKQSYPETTLVLSGGKKNGYAEAVALVQTLGLNDSVIFPGYISEEEMIALYSKTAALVMPTFFGPTNIPPLEAISFRANVVYSKIYAYQEFLPSDVIFVDPKDVDDIASGMMKSLSMNERKNHSAFIQKKNTDFKKILRETLESLPADLVRE
jgi:glycosyltransferase involved in cell wall biosynthesis